MPDATWKSLAAPSTPKNKVEVVRSGEFFLVYIDGVRLDGIRQVSTQKAHDLPPTITIEFHPRDFSTMEVDAHEFNTLLTTDLQPSGGG